jgi:predicted DNA-binding protein
MRKLTVIRLSQEDREFLENFAKKYDITVSDAVRIILREYIERSKEK